MKSVPIALVKPGMRLARTVFNTRGDVLLRRGTELNDRYVDMLRARGYASVLIGDPNSDDFELADLLSERVRATVTSDVCQLYSGIALAAEDAALVDAIEKVRDSVVVVVEEVMAGPALVVLRTMRARDTYFFEHAIDGTIVALLIGRRLGYDKNALQRLAAGCLTRDVGMMRIPDAVLNKSSSLDPDEWKLVRGHPQEGFDLLHRLRPGSMIPNAVALQHHERQDGYGYPSGLRGTNRASQRAGPDRIVLDAEIAAVADVFDALGSDRPHRPALLPDRVVGELELLAGSQLNRENVGKFLSILPVYPVGTEVLLRSGAYQGYRGVVVAVDPTALARPVVRVHADRYGKRISPFEVDLRRDTGVLAAIALHEPVH